MFHILVMNFLIFPNFSWATKFSVDDRIQALRDHVPISIIEQITEAEKVAEKSDKASVSSLNWDGFVGCARKNLPYLRQLADLDAGQQRSLLEGQAQVETGAEFQDLNATRWSAESNLSLACGRYLGDLGRFQRVSLENEIFVLDALLAREHQPANWVILLLLLNWAEEFHADIQGDAFKTDFLKAFLMKAAFAKNSLGSLEDIESEWVAFLGQAVKALVSTPESKVKQRFRQSMLSIGKQLDPRYFPVVRNYFEMHQAAETSAVASSESAVCVKQEQTVRQEGSNNRADLEGLKRQVYEGVKSSVRVFLMLEEEEFRDVISILMRDVTSESEILVHHRQIEIQLENHRNFLNFSQLDHDLLMEKMRLLRDRLIIRSKDVKQIETRIDLLQQVFQTRFNREHRDLLMKRLSPYLQMLDLSESRENGVSESVPFQIGVAFNFAGGASGLTPQRTGLVGTIGVLVAGKMMESAIGSAVVVAGMSAPTTLLLGIAVTGAVLAYDLVDYGLKRSAVQRKNHNFVMQQFRHEEELRQYVDNFDMTEVLRDLFSEGHAQTDIGREIPKRFEEVKILLESEKKKISDLSHLLDRNILELKKDRGLNRQVPVPGRMDLVLQRSIIKASSIRARFDAIRQHPDAADRIERIRSRFSLWLELSRELRSFDIQADPIWSFQHGTNLNENSPVYRRELLSLEMQNGFDIFSSV